MLSCCNRVQSALVLSCSNRVHSAPVLSCSNRVQPQSCLVATGFSLRAVMSGFSPKAVLTHYRVQSQTKLRASVLEEGCQKPRFGVWSQVCLVMLQGSTPSCLINVPSLCYCCSMQKTLVIQLNAHTPLTQ